MRNQFGLSLVELMISVTLGLLLMAGVVQMFISSNRVFGTQQDLSRIQETGRLGVEFIGRDLRMASFSGCRNTVIEQGTSRIADPLTNPPGNSLGLVGLHRNFTEGLHGYSIDSSGGHDLPTGISTDLGSSFTVARDSDIIVIRGGNERGMLVKKVNTATEVYGYSDQSLDTNNCIEGLCNNSIAVVSNCRNGRVFKLSTSPTITSGEVTLTHADSWIVTDPSNDIYTQGSITPIHTIAYFVATSATPLGNTTPSLWQKIDNEPAVEILQGVERLGLLYMVKPTASKPNPPYEVAADVDTWDLISSVQAEIVVRGDKPFELDSPQSYPFRTGTITPTDRYMRKVFKATFSLRSRNP
ncbi:pilus assembly protein PilW [Cellvibrio zantedeschiae]|uniref:Pilus assembly protein PilW n=1 Tax=Cellvibrio zantedeschiae TaxID=1237077 RepID=A0ABQ3B5R4_9GAMM|nr:PilW family protein [Cellvibrio zantedeschiae]GGY80616.1 pilus assembly protein PilW [Cellvibrio zantedeschiae]